MTEPLTDGGVVDYAAALNQRHRQGATIENNAVVLFWQAIGAAAIPQPARDEYFQLLGVAAPPDEGEYLIPLNAFIKQRKPDLVGDELFDYFDRIERTRNRPWRADEFPLVAAWIEANQRPLKLLDEGSRRRQCYSPIVAKDGDIGRSETYPVLVTGLREAVSLLTTRAMLHLGEGQAAAAWRDLETCFHIAQQLGDGGSLGFALVGTALANSAVNAAGTLVQYAELEARQFDHIQQQLRDASRPSAMSDKTRLVERCTYLQFIATRALLDPDERKRREPINLKMFDICFGRKHDIDWNAVLRLANDHFGRMMQLARVDDPRERVEQAKQFSEQLRSLNGRLPRMDDLKGLALLGDLEDPEGFEQLLADAPSPQARAELVATALSSFFVAVWTSAIQADQQIAERCRLTQTAVALAAYRRDRAEYPANLENLVPSYLPRILRSASTGSEFAYHRAGDGYVLSSVGSSDVAGMLYDLTIVDRRQHEQVVAALQRRDVPLEIKRSGVYRVDLSRTESDDDDLAVLSILAEVEMLTLRGLPITDRGVAHLKTFNRLWYLDLSDTAITDESVKHLRSLSQLASLQIEGTEVSDEAVRQLQRALPKCEIER